MSQTKTSAPISAVQHQATDQNRANSPF